MRGRSVTFCFFKSKPRSRVIHACIIRSSFGQDPGSPAGYVSARAGVASGPRARRFTLRLISIHLVTVSDSKSERKREREDARKREERRGRKEKEGEKEKRRTIVLAARGDRRVSAFSNARRLARSMARSDPAALFLPWAQWRRMRGTECDFFAIYLTASSLDRFVQKSH